eukprot:Phypoly_transcript_18969.p1 GENE.Phypoly_transcript_18969~~Phypoly_transcript_18969.p1  ORF type:complete len:192 (+),score=47.18 Phypoly_transcript_18969:3-578(+)
MVRFPSYFGPQDFEFQKGKRARPYFKRKRLLSRCPLFVFQTTRTHSQHSQEHKMVAKKEKKEAVEGERKSSRTSKQVERLSVSPPTILKKKATKKSTTASKTKSPKKAGAKKGTKKAKGEKGPKRPASAYLLFANENRAKVKKANPDATFGELGKLLGEAWSNATAADKKKFTALADKDKARYEKEKAALA